MKLGIIGAGNMASAILGGILKKGVIPREDIRMSDRDEAKLKEKESEGIKATTDNREVVKESEIIIFAVKPQVLPAVLSEVKTEITPDKRFVSIVAGIAMEKIKAMTECEMKLVRIMPNTPLLVGEGMSVLSAGEGVTDAELREIESLFATAGKTAILPEHLMDAVTAASGSSPAYVFMMIEAMADAAVQGGIPRDIAYQICAQAVLGSAQMVLSTGLHPATLKDMVCSPGGTTIEAVKVLEEEGFRASLMDAMEACMKRSKELGE